MELRGSLGNCTTGTISSIFTTFYVDHDEPLEALAFYKKEWILGELLDDHEFLIILPTDIFWSQMIDDNLDDGADVYSLIYVCCTCKANGLFFATNIIIFLCLRERTEIFRFRLASFQRSASSPVFTTPPEPCQKIVM